MNRGRERASSRFDRSACCYADDLDVWGLKLAVMKFRLSEGRRCRRAAGPASSARWRSAPMPSHAADSLKVPPDQWPRRCVRRAHVTLWIS